MGRVTQVVSSAALAAMFLTLSPQAHAIPVGLELALLVDVSGSIDATEYDLQKMGYVSAFQDAGIQSSIAALSGGVAVTFIEWSGATQQAQKIGWTLLTNGTEADAFAAAIAATVRSFHGDTASGSAINFAYPLFAGNGFEGAKLLIDISGDGLEDSGADTSDARDAALAAGIDAINGLPILGEAGLLAFYQNEIQGGTNSFVVPAASFADFDGAVTEKIGRETRAVPEPASLLLLGTGLIGASLLSRRRKKRA